ncbi:MAG TPA: YdcF family protein [Gemmatimonadaceae bacterium]|nr:YdcF family protein [Gemmatimonadaceae bacterium]
MEPRRPSRWKKAARGIAAGLACAWLAALFTVVVWGKRDTARPAGAIVVLGAAQYVGRPSPVLRARLDHAIALWQRGLAPRLVLTGGTGHGDTTSEAAVGRRYVVQRGVPDSAVMLEAEGRTTSASLRAVAAMMAARSVDTVILVSDPFHMWRLSILARRFGLTPLVSPTLTSPISANWRERWTFRLSESLKAPLAFLVEWPVAN